MVGYFLVRKFAPEAGGSGIPEIEGALEELRPVRWWRVIPVKFIGGMGTLGAGMVLGREGPTVQLGGNVGRMVGDMFRMRSAEARHTLLATGAAAGLSAAFNAPLAGILFIIEEMRAQFRYNLISIKAVFTGVIMSSIVFRIFNGEGAVIEVGKLTNAPVNTLWLYLILGMIFGVVGPLFNTLILRAQDMFQRIHGGNTTKWVLMGGLLGGMCGVLGVIEPNAAGGGFGLIPIAAAGNFSVGLLLFMFISRVITTVLCFSSGAPGGILRRCWRWVPAGTAFGMAAAAGSRPITLMRDLCDCRNGGAAGRLSARAVDRDRAGAGDDGQLPAHFANDHYLSRRDTISPIPGWKTAILHHSCAYPGKTRGGTGRHAEYLNELPGY
jgi:CIC family chloride channel protein